ncbi:hypothetical protein [Micromonospora auratinigra]|uniref:Streptomycin adenylyltransferase n=1 Tax=Micromonospora auratinigra TaxID=261654 RepID=A0A1A8Z107_9ACTN|nr:hypothetical protein [Micromonospora auratinigra]SBT37423.1 hypothetical protein GA0070611_0203 [Micromonospora auratinigra]
MHPMLRRLDDLAGHLATRPDTLALLALGSAGAEHDRLDDHSDLDFFLVVADGAVASYVDSVDWLAAPCPVAYSFRNERNGRKARYADGVFVEYAVFTVDELTRLPVTGVRVVWQRADVPVDLASCAPPPRPATPYDTVEFHLNEALTNLYVGLHRELRGERLTATRFIQSYAVDRVLALVRLTDPAAVGHRRDPFDPSRRVEQAYPPPVLPLAAMVPGYDRNVAAARTTLDWLAARFPVDPAIADPIRALLGAAERSGR